MRATGSGFDTRRAIVLLVILAAGLAAIAPVRNYDFFWHLATGRWILEHRALPRFDPFAVASDRVPWVNGEWLFEVLLYPLHEGIGIRGLSVLRGLALAAILAMASFVRSKPPNDSETFHASLLAFAIAFAGATATFDIRPSSLAMLFLIVALRAQSPAAHAINAVLWMNVHPSAILAPLVAAIRTRRLAPALASGAALLVNPFGIRGVVAPIELTWFASSRAFVNAEWLPSPWRVFPILYIAIAAAVAAVLFSADKRTHWWRIVLLALFAYLAVRHVRNQALFFAAFAALIVPMAPRVSRAVASSVAVAAILFVVVRTDHRLGVVPERFPVTAVARLQATRFEGNIYNPDQFGGFLEHAFYPARRALTDGRNELYRTYIPEYARARRDQRAWLALLAKYRIDLAVDEYAKPLEVTDARTGATTRIPASLAFWPRSRWALIGFDRAGMVFARRAAFPAEEIVKWEITGVVPDAR